MTGMHTAIGAPKTIAGNQKDLGSTWLGHESKTNKCNLQGAPRPKIARGKTYCTLCIVMIMHVKNMGLEAKRKESK